MALGATIMVWLVMSLWALPRLSGPTGPIFDLRFAGYDHAAADALLQDLGPEGRGFYLSVQQRLDWVFPALLGLTLVLWVRGVAGAGLARGLGLIALVGAGLDYAENLVVRRMLVTASADGAEIASRLTQLKFGADAVVIGAALILSLIALVGRERR